MTGNNLLSLYMTERRWVNWTVRDGRKVPVDARTGRSAKSDDSDTWDTYARAKERDASHIGIMLGEVKPDGWVNINGKELEGWSICGIDLDNCLLNGNVLLPEAKEIVERFKKYTEISPSGKGVHIIFAVSNDVIAQVREKYGINHRTTFSIGKHEEIALDLSHRFYTFTGEVFKDYYMEDQITFSDLEWFLRDAGPAFQGKYVKNGGAVIARDQSGSGHGIRFFMSMIAKGLTEDEANVVAHGRKDHVGDWHRRVDKRQHQRAWTAAMEQIERKQNEGNEVDFLTSTLASDIVMKPINWMWPNYFAFGKLAMIAGNANLGKSTVVIDIVSRVSKGKSWPDKQGRAPRGDILMLNAEDDPADTLTPRLAAAGADMRRVHVLRMQSGRMFSLMDVKMLESHISKETRVVTIDPVTAYFGVAKVDTHKGTDVRGVMGPLVELAERKGVLILLVAHFNKNTNHENALHRISDSQALHAICRHIYGCFPDPDNEGDFLFLKMRNSVAKQGRGEGLAYSLESVDLGDRIITSRVVWHDDPVEISADEALKSPKKSGNELERAMEFLRESCANGPANSRVLKEKAEGMSIAERTLQRARKNLNMIVTNELGNFIWALPTRTQPT